MENSRCFCPHFNYINYQKISSIQLISLILIFSCSSDSLFSLRLLCCCLREFPYSGYLATAYLRITSLRLPCSGLCENFLSSLRLPCGHLLKNFLIEAALWLLPWEFPHWGCLGTDCLKISSWRLLIYWNFILEDTLLRLHDWGGMIEAYSGKLPLLGRLPQMGWTLLFFH